MGRRKGKIEIEVNFIISQAAPLPFLFWIFVDLSDPNCFCVSNFWHIACWRNCTPLKKKEFFSISIFSFLITVKFYLLKCFSQRIFTTNLKRNEHYSWDTFLLFYVFKLSTHLPILVWKRMELIVDRFNVNESKKKNSNTQTKFYCYTLSQTCKCLSTTACWGSTIFKINNFSNEADVAMVPINYCWQNKRNFNLRDCNKFFL
jgi:hypothetical protein